MVLVLLDHQDLQAHKVPHQQVVQELKDFKAQQAVFKVLKDLKVVLVHKVLQDHKVIKAPNLQERKALKVLKVLKEEIQVLQDLQVVKVVQVLKVLKAHKVQVLQVY